MSPMMVPAMTGPTPKTWVRVVPETLTAAASFLRVSRSWASRRRMSSRNSAASSLGAGQFDGTGRGDLPEDPGGLSRGDLLRVAAGDQIAEHGVQPAGDLVT